MPDLRAPHGAAGLTSRYARRMPKSYGAVALSLAVLATAGLSACGGDSRPYDEVPASTPALVPPGDADSIAGDVTTPTTPTTTTTTPDAGTDTGTDTGGTDGTDTGGDTGGGGTDTGGGGGTDNGGGTAPDTGGVTPN